jgi:hypothetical protein
VVDGDTIYADQITNNCYTFENVTEPHQIYAAFKRITFTIFAEADEHSTITPNGSIEVIKGENYPFIIEVTDDCYEIDSVFIDGVYNQSVSIQMKYNNGGIYTFQYVSADHSIRIATKQKEFILSSSSENGTITPTQKVNCGENITFTFYPANDYYQFDKLLVDNEEVIAVGDTAYTFTNVTENHTILALFKQKTGIANIDPSSIKIYPNPVDNLLTIESSEIKIGDKIDIFDMSGKLVLSQKINETDKVIINVSRLSQGTYIFKLGNIHGKFVKK